MSECIVFRSEDLLPDAWLTLAAGGPVRMFNPGLLRDGDGWIFAYRVVASDGKRRIALCRLDRRLQIIGGSAMAWSDTVVFPDAGAMPDVATHWFADPRLYRFGDRLFIYWNSGWHEPRNYQFLQELDPTTLRAAGPPRELRLRGERQKLEKNWTLFENAGRQLAIYSILPHRILEFSLAGSGSMEFNEVATTPWALSEYPRSHGGLRGGAPAVPSDGMYWVFCHSVHDGEDGYRYLPAVYRFGGTFPFAPVDEPLAPLALPNPQGPRRLYPRLNTAVGEVIYPCGAACEGDCWLISHGINDEHCAISIVTRAEVEATLRPVARRR